MKHKLILLGLLITSYLGFAQRLIKDINTLKNGGSIGNQFEIVELNGIGYFNAYTESFGTELWRTDGTEAGTWMVKDIEPLSQGSIFLGNGYYNERVWQPIIFNGLIVFNAYTTTNALELWVSDGTADGTHLLKDLTAVMELGSSSGGYNLHDFIIKDGFLWFMAFDSSNKMSLFKTDGTTDGTVMAMKDVFTQSAGLGARITSLTLYQDKFYGILNETEFFRLDFNTGKRITIKTFDEIGYLARNNQIVEMNNALYFRAKEPVYGNEIWKYQFDEANKKDIIEVVDATPGTESTYPFSLTVMNGNIYFIGYDATNKSELWTSDGTAEGTHLLKDINPTGDSKINLSGYTGGGPIFQYQNKLYFSANDGVNGNELWMSDGTTDGTVFVADLFNGTNGSDPNYFTVFNNKIYFTGRYNDYDNPDTDNAGNVGYQLYSFDPATLKHKVYFIRGSGNEAITGAPSVAMNNLYYGGSYDYTDVLGFELHVLDDTLLGVASDLTLPNNSIVLSPNPATTQFQIQTENVNYPLTVSIINTVGQLCAASTINNQNETINIELLNKGFYFVEFIDSKSKKQTQKLIKN